MTWPPTMFPLSTGQRTQKHKQKKTSAKLTLFCTKKAKQKDCISVEKWLL